MRVVAFLILRAWEYMHVMSSQISNRNLGLREMLKRGILSERIGETHYLCSEITYNGNGKKIQGNSVGDRRK